MMGRSVLRLVDASANRALEGLRVCEDIARFHLESARAFRALRALRHAVAEAVAALPGGPAALVQARDSRADVGRRAPASRLDTLERVLIINFQRVKESLRTLEECTRCFAPGQTARFQQLRFRTYDTERHILLHVASVRHR
jgi:thiamine-phosphate pyrophosphorylase